MEKNTKKDVKVIKNNIENNDKLTIDDKVMIKEIEDKIASMKEDKEKKCKSAKKQLIDMLEVTVNKYRTATGTAEALRVLRFVSGDMPVDIFTANTLAIKMAVTTEDMCEKAKKLTYVEMDKLCDGFYEKEFKVSDELSLNDQIYNLAFEMMCIDLCRNVGGAAEDMVEFIKRVQDEIDSTGKKLKELKAKEK